MLTPSSRVQHDLDAAVLLVAERLVHRRPLLERNLVGDDEGRVDLSLLDPAQQVIAPAADVRLPGAHRDALVHQHAERDLVAQPAVDARYREYARRATDV